MVSASEHPAARSGRRTVFVGERIAAVSAMKCTPQKTITSAGLGSFARQTERIANKVRHVLDFGAFVVVGEDDGIALLRQSLDAF